MRDTVVTSLSRLSFGVTYEVHLTNGDMFRAELQGNIGFSGNIALVWFVVEGKRREVRANNFISATPVS